jgi:hypothetical protein
MDAALVATLGVTMRTCHFSLTLPVKRSGHSRVAREREQ